MVIWRLREVEQRAVDEWGGIDKMTILIVDIGTRGKPSGYSKMRRATATATLAGSLHEANIKSGELRTRSFIVLTKSLSWGMLDGRNPIGSGTILFPGFVARHPVTVIQMSVINLDECH